MRYLPHLCWLWITVTFIWDAPTSYVDGTPLPPSQIAKYRIYRKFHSCSWPKGAVAERTTNTYVWDAPDKDVDGGPNINVYEVYVTAVGTNGLESGRSNIVVVNMNTYKPPAT